MIKFIELGWKNFQSYGNNMTSISLDFSDPIAIIGKNLDASVAGIIDSNGAGKTTILNALCYALYDRVISDIKKDKLINWINAKNMETYIIFEKNGIFYKIERFRKFSKKGGDGAKIYQNTTGIFSEGDKDIAESSIALINVQIEKILGIPFDVFERTALFSSATPSFYSLPATSSAGKTCQTDILEELFGYKEISQKAEILKKKITDNKRELERITELNSHLLQEKNRLDSQISFTKNEHDQWNIANKIEIEKLQQNIKQQSEINFDEEHIIFAQIAKNETKIQENIFLIKEKEMIKTTALSNKTLHDKWDDEHKENIYSVEKTITNFKDIDFDYEIKKIDDIEAKNKEKDKLNQQLNDILKEVNKLRENEASVKKELEHLADNKCPYCLQEFKNTISKISELKQSLNIITENIKNYKNVTIKVENDLSIIIEYVSKTMSSFRSKQDIMQKKLELQIAKEKLVELENSKNPYTIVGYDETISKDIGILNNEIVLLKSKIDKFKKLQKFSTERELQNIESSLASAKHLLENILTRQNPHGNILDKLLSTLLPENKNKEIEKLSNDIEHQDFLYKLLTKKDSYIRKALLNKNLPFLNTRLKHHLSNTGLPHKVVFTENMTANISQFGTAIDYANLSTGQKCRIDLATSFAFRDILQTRHEKINFCMLDEYLDSGLSTVGSVMVAKALKGIAKNEKISLFIISHKEEITSLFTSKIEVELNNKFSNIVYADIKYSSS